MTAEPMTPDEEHAFYADPENQEPQGPPRQQNILLALHQTMSTVGGVDLEVPSRTVQPLADELP